MQIFEVEILTKNDGSRECDSDFEMHVQNVYNSEQVI